MTHQTEGSACRESGLTVNGWFDPWFEGVANETGDKPTQRDVLLLGDPAEVAEEIVGQGNPNLRRCVRRDFASATRTASSAKLSVMSVVHSLILLRRNPQEKSREAAQFSLPVLR